MSHGRRGRIATAAIVGAAVAMLAPLPIRTAAHAQRPSPELLVTGLQTVVSDADSLLHVDVTVRNPGPAEATGLEVAGALHRRTASRFGFQQAMEDGEVGTVIERLPPVTVDAIAPNASRAVSLQVPASDLGLGRAAQQGVYPLRLTLEQDGELLDEVMTSVIAAPPEAEQPIRLALVLPIDRAPGVLADGSYDPRLPQVLAAGGVLDRVGRELEREATVPMTLMPSGFLLEQITDLADGYRPAGAAADVTAENPGARQAAAFLERIRAVAGRPGIEELNSTYGPADLVALVRSGLADEARRELVEGAGAVERTTAQHVLQDALAVPDGLDEATFAMLQGEGVRTLLLQANQVAASGRAVTTTPSPVRRLESGEVVLVPDPFLDEVLLRPASADGGPVDAQRVLAETAAVYFERPFATQPRGLMVVPPAVWSAPDGLLSTLLTGMREASWLQPVNLTGLRREVEPAQDVELAYPADARGRELDSRYLTQMRDARAALGSFASTLPAGDETAGRFDRMLLAAASVWFRTGPLHDEGEARLGYVRQTVDTTYGAVRVVEDQPVTLTSIDDQQMPVTIVSDAPVPLRVRVRLEATPIAFEEGNTQIAVLEPGVPTTLTFAVRVITPGGTFAANVFVEDPEGARRLAEGSVQVRSAAYSVVALVVTAGAGAFLLAWWIREVVRRRNQRTSSTHTPAPDPVSKL